MNQLEVFVLLLSFSLGYGSVQQPDASDLNDLNRGVICKEDLGHESFYWNERCDYCVFAEGRHNGSTIYRHHACMRGKTDKLKEFTTKHTYGTAERLSMSEYYLECQTHRCNDIGMGNNNMPIYPNRFFTSFNFTNDGDPIWTKVRHHPVDDLNEFTLGGK